MQNDLIEIADMLDKKGLRKEADFVDSMIKVAADRTRAVQNFIDAIKIGFQNAAKEPKLFPNIQKALPEIFKVIDTMSEHRSFVDPHITSDTVESLKTNSIRELAESVLARQEDIEDIKSN